MNQENSNKSNSIELFNGLLKKSGLNFTNILNHIYIVRNKEPIDEKLPLQDRIDLVLKNLGLKQIEKSFNKDTYYGLLIDYGWNNTVHLNSEIDKLIKLFPEDKDRLDTIKRRLAYLNYLDSEIKFITERYDFDRIPVLIDWLTNKFERHATLTAELCLTIIEYYHNKPNKYGIRFEEMIKYIYDIDKIFKYLNATVDGFIITTIRNEIVHSTGYKIKRDTDKFSININEVKVKPNFGLLEDYVKDAFNLFCSQKKVHGKDILVNDPRFPYINLIYRVSKKGTIVWEDTTINIEFDLENYLKRTSNYIYLLGITLFQKKISEKNKTM